MRFHDTGGTTQKDGSDKKESHFDHLLVSESTRLLHQYYPTAPPGGRPALVYKSYVPKSNVLRSTEPRVRSYDLSDHLPLRFQDPLSQAVIGTWNLQNFQVRSTGKSGRKEYDNRVEYTRMFEQFNILALQELSGSAATLYNKALVVSSHPDAKELGIAFDASILKVIQCTDLPVNDPVGTATPKTYRPMFGCTFETLTTSVSA